MEEKKTNQQHTSPLPVTGRLLIFGMLSVTFFLFPQPALAATTTLGYSSHEQDLCMHCALSRIADTRPRH